VLVDQFQASKSQRRVLRKNADISVVVQAPSVTAEHVRIFNAYHADMSERRGWSENATSREDYENSFLIGMWPFAREMLYLRDGRLIGVGLVDVTLDALSSVYFYHDPAWRDAGPGTFSVLQELEFCRRTGRRFNYLGYWIEACPSMTYKSRFGPHEVLERYVDAPEEPVWRRVGE
jgi:arginine-tRNA-protein transferase